MNDMIIKIQDEVIEITKYLNTAIAARNELKKLEGCLNEYMQIEESPLDDCKAALDQVINGLVYDLYLKVSDTLYQIGIMQEELDDMPDEQELAILDKLLDKGEKTAEQKGGGND